MSIVDIADTIVADWQSEEKMEALKAKVPGLRDRIDESIKYQEQKAADAKRVSSLPTEDQRGRPIDGNTFPRLAHLLASFRKALGEDKIKFHTSPREDIMASASGSYWINVSERYARGCEILLERIANGELSNKNANAGLNQILDILVHEYVHLLEHRESGYSSHHTHQSDGELERSFPNRMREVVEKLAQNGWDLQEAVNLPPSNTPALSQSTFGTGLALIFSAKILIPFLMASGWFVWPAFGPFLTVAGFLAIMYGFRYNIAHLTGRSHLSGALCGIAYVVLGASVLPLALRRSSRNLGRSA